MFSLSDEQRGALLNMYATGISVRDAIAAMGLACTPLDIYKFFRSAPELYAEWQAARAALADHYGGDVVSIADTDSDHARARNRIDARKWAASKCDPKTYGDKLDVNVNQTIDIGTTLREARARQLRPVRDQLPETFAQLIDSTAERVDSAPHIESEAPKGGPIE